MAGNSRGCKIQIRKMESQLKLTFISKSDLRGGAAIVTYRLVEELRRQGADARMLVAEKLSDSEFVALAASPLKIKTAFLAERMQVFAANGCNRKDLFKIDPASEGLPLWKHPWVKDADAIFLGWINQGVLSLKGIGKLAELRKPLVWIMHDMWNMTGICHHAGSCSHFKSACGDCHFLGKCAEKNDLSHKVWEKKKSLYAKAGIKFVAVSSWLAGKARESSLMRNVKVEVIPNPFPLPESNRTQDSSRSGVVSIVFGAARLDDDIKGLPVLKKALEILKTKYPDVAENIQLVTFGAVKDPASLQGFSIAHRYLGILQGAESLGNAYQDADIVVSSSDFETLPGTLVEGQAYGCVPVAFDHGGQKDIIEHKLTGYLADWADDQVVRAGFLADGLAWAYANCRDKALKTRMRRSVEERFCAPAVARRILGLVSQKDSESNSTSKEEVIAVM